MTQPVSLLIRFLEKVKFSVSGCWLWTGSNSGSEYGRIAVRVRRGYSQNEYAHRVSYRLFNGPTPKRSTKLNIHHICENKRCVRPDHLRKVTVWENGIASEGTLMHWIKERGDSKTCLYGHTDLAYSGKQRYCRDCCRIRAANTRALRE